MLVNIKILFINKESWIIILILATLAFGGKYIAAIIFQKFNKLKSYERNLIFGLSSARAASAIAIMLVGYEFNLVDETLMNSSILLILLTCLISSMVTQRSGKKISLADNRDKKTVKKKTEKIMVSVANPDNIEQLIDFSLLIKAPKSESPLYPITVIRDNNSAQNQIDKKRKLLQSVLEHASSADKQTELITRIDVNIIDGIVRAIKELSITKVVVGWNGNTTTVEKLFGSFLEHLLDKTEKQLLVAKLETSLGLSGDIRVFLPPAINQERGFNEMLETLNNLSRHLGRSISYHGDSANMRAVKVITKDLSVQPELKEIRISELYFKELTSNGLSKKDIIVIVNSRKNTLSASRLTSRYPKIIQKYFCFNNLIMIYPNQKIYPSGMYHLYNLN